MRPPPKQHRTHKWHWLIAADGSFSIASWGDVFGWAGVVPYVTWKYYAPAIPPQNPHLTHFPR